MTVVRFTITRIDALWYIILILLMRHALNGGKAQT